MTLSANSPQLHSQKPTGQPPDLRISKLGIVSRDYRHKGPNRYRDFSYSLQSVLELLDIAGCDAALFSLFSVVPRKTFDLQACFKNLRIIKAVFLEEFEDGGGKVRRGGRYVVHYRSTRGWKEYAFRQRFGSIARPINDCGIKRSPAEFMGKFVDEEMPKRVLGNGCVLLCGESNGVKYSPSDQRVHDSFGMAAAIPKEVEIILNPIHDRMTRFEMKRKRRFLSRSGRWVVSVWNKGKADKNGTVKDGGQPAWTVFHDGNKTEVNVRRIDNELGLEIGVLNTSQS